MVVVNCLYRVRRLSTSDRLTPQDRSSTRSMVARHARRRARQTNAGWWTCRRWNRRRTRTVKKGADWHASGVARGVSNVRRRRKINWFACGRRTQYFNSVSWNWRGNLDARAVDDEVARLLVTHGDDNHDYCDSVHNTIRHDTIRCTIFTRAQKLTKPA